MVLYPQCRRVLVSRAHSRRRIKHRLQPLPHHRRRRIISNTADRVNCHASLTPMALTPLHHPIASIHRCSERIPQEASTSSRSTRCSLSRCSHHSEAPRLQTASWSLPRPWEPLPQLAARPSLHRSVPLRVPHRPPRPCRLC